MAIRPKEVRAKFPADPIEFNGVSFKNMRDIHKVINRELIATGMNYRKVAEKYDYNLDSLYRVARMQTSRAYREWLGDSLRSEQIASAQEVLQTLTDILREDTYDEHITPRGDKVIKKVDNKDVLKAAELLAKSYGLLVEKQINKTEQTIVVDIEGLDDEDDIIDITPEQETSEEVK